MKYTVLTLFPEIIDAYFAASIMAKAVDRGIVSYRAVNIRDFALDRHHTCDDAPYGGGAGMLMLAEPLGRALEAVGVGSREWGVGSGDEGGSPPPRSETCGFSAPPPSGVAAPPRNAPPNGAGCHNGGGWESPVEGGSGGAGAGGELSTGEASFKRASPSSIPHSPRVIYLSPSGRPFTQALAAELAREEELVLLCGRYEGIDQRIIDLYVDDEVSIGDYVLSSGEAAALTLIDATYRLVGDVISPASLEEESFSGGLLEYPQYTRPELYATMKVPEILLSGHHENIRRWRLRKRVEKTLALRPDLIGRGEAAGLFDAETRKIIAEIREWRGDDERDQGDRSLPDEERGGSVQGGRHGEGPFQDR